MEFDNIETVKRAVEIESGVSIVPEQYRAAGGRERRARGGGNRRIRRCRARSASSPSATARVRRRTRNSSTRCAKAGWRRGFAHRRPASRPRSVRALRGAAKIQNDDEDESGRGRRMAHTDFPVSKIAGAPISRRHASTSHRHHRRQRPLPNGRAHRVRPSTPSRRLSARRRMSSSAASSRDGRSIFSRGTGAAIASCRTS